MTQEVLQTKEAELNNSLVSLFQEHGIECRLTEDEVLFPQQQMSAHCHIQDNSSNGNTVVIVYVILETGVDQHIVEAFAGFGQDINEAVSTGFKAFILNSFHVLLSAFFTNQFDDQIRRFEITIQGKPFDVFLSNGLFRGKRDFEFSYDWLDLFIEELQMKEIQDGTHWIRIYRAQMNEKEITAEVLLDNEPQEDLQKGEWRNDFPARSDFYGVRVFMVLRNKTDIHRLAATVAWMAEEEDEQKIDYLVQNGVAEEDAFKAVTFIPMAFADVFMKNQYDIEIPEETTVINEKNEEYPYSLVNEPIYQDAVKLATGMLENQRDMQKYGPIVYQSSTFDVLNQILNKGDDPRDCTIATMVYWPDYKG